MPKPRRPALWRVVVLVFAVLSLCAAFVTGLLAPVSSGGRPVEVFVPRGASVSRVGQILKQKGLVRSALAFRLMAQARGDWNVKAGIYTLSPSLSTGQILKELRNGAAQEMVRLTFPEGFTVARIAERASRIRTVRADEFHRLARTQGATFTASVRLPDDLEGYLFPDTYDFRPDATERDVIQAMLKAFDEKVVREMADDLRASAARGYGLGEVLTLASLIEREARVREEQPRIASVLYNRLRIKMPLQVDATVQYVIGHRERLYYRDLEVNSPYNTYKVAGLPPGPICSPGADAIRAAMHPETTEYLYYTARPDGSHSFTKTLEEHNRATRAARAAR